MDAAEELFSAFGVEGVSIRSVNAAAGLAPVAVHYHFRSKDRLLEAVVLRRGKAITRRAAELLDALEAHGKPPTAQDVIRAIAIPYRELLESDPVGGLRWLRLIGRLVLAEDPRLHRLNAAPGGVEERLSRFVHWAFPDVPEGLLEMAWRISFGILMMMLGNSDARLVHEGGGPGKVSETYVDTLVDLVATGFAGAMAAKRLGPHGKRRRPAKS
jgi:AcrR family transcriptional regulator